jgi:hypothetical protein
MERRTIKIGDYVNIDGGHHKVLSITKDKVLVEGGSENGKNGYVGYNFAIKNKIEKQVIGKYVAGFEVHVDQLEDMKPFLKKQKVEFRCVEYVDTDVYIVDFVSDDKGKLWDIYKEVTGSGEEDENEFYNEQISSFKKWGKDVYGAHTHDDESEYYTEEAKNGANIEGGKHYIVKNIKYDADIETQSKLPKELKIIVPTDVQGYEDIEYYISEEISNQTGYAHEGFDTVPEIEEYGNGGGVGKKPKMVRTIFEDEEYEYKNGANIKGKPQIVQYEYFKTPDMSDGFYVVALGDKVVWLANDSDAIESWAKEEGYNIRSTNGIYFSKKPKGAPEWETEKFSTLDSEYGEDEAPYSGYVLFRKGVPYFVGNDDGDFEDIKSGEYANGGGIGGFNYEIGGL